MTAGVALAAAALDHAADAGAEAEAGALWLQPGLASALALLGALLWFKTLTIEIDGGAPLRLGPWRAWLAVPVALGAFAWLWPQVGLAVASLALVLIALWAWPAPERAHGPSRWVALLPAVVLAAVVAWVLQGRLPLAWWPAIAFGPG